MKKLLVILMFLAVRGYSQVTYTPMTAAGYQFKYIKSDSGFAMPYLDTTLGRGINRAGAIVTRPGDKLPYYYDGTKWVLFGTGGTGGSGTTTLQQAFNNDQKANPQINFHSHAANFDSATSFSFFTRNGTAGKYGRLSMAPGSFALENTTPTGVVYGTIISSNDSLLYLNANKGSQNGFIRLSPTNAMISRANGSYKSIVTSLNGVLADSSGNLTVDLTANPGTTVYDTIGYVPLYIPSFTNTGDTIKKLEVALLPHGVDTAYATTDTTLHFQRGADGWNVLFTKTPASQTLQQVFDVESAKAVLNKFDTISAGSNILQITGTSTSTGVAPLIVSNNTANTSSRSIIVTATTGTALNASATSGIGISATSSTGTAISGSSASTATGVDGSSATGLGVQSTTGNSGSNTPTTLLLRSTYAGAASNGAGVKMDFSTTTNFSGSPLDGRISNSIISKWNNVTDGSRTSQLEITGVDNAVTKTWMILDSVGIKIPDGIMPTSGNGSDSVVARNATTGQFYLTPNGAGAGTPGINDVLSVNQFLQSPQTIELDGNALTISGGDLLLTGVTSGATTDSVMTINASTGKVTWRNASSLGGGVSFTDFKERSTGSTSTSRTLSHTPLFGSAVEAFLNGVLMDTTQYSITGTAVTISGFTPATSDVFTFKYSY